MDININTVMQDLLAFRRSKTRWSKMTSLVQFVPQVSVSQLNGFAERGEVITEDGEVLKVDEASNDDLVAWSLVATYLRDLARLISTSVEPELADRIHTIGGPITATHGTARETISRASVSGIEAKRIRASSKSAPQMV
jgi:hypothetical protein